MTMCCCESCSASCCGAQPLTFGCCQTLPKHAYALWGPAPADFLLLWHRLPGGSVRHLYHVSQQTQQQACAMLCSASPPASHSSSRAASGKCHALLCVPQSWCLRDAVCVPQPRLWVHGRPTKTAARVATPAAASSIRTCFAGMLQVPQRELCAGSGGVAVAQ